MDLTQRDTKDLFEALDSEAWTTVSASWHKEDGNGGIYVAFSSPDKREKAVSAPEWNLLVGDFRPGFSQHHEGDEWVTAYAPSSISDGYEPLVLAREYYGIVPSTVEIVEQFRLYHNLYWDDAESAFMQPRDDGTSLAAVRITDNRTVEVRTRLLRQYQAARQLDLLLFIDSVRFTDTAESLPEATEWATGLLRASLLPGEGQAGLRPFTRYLGTKVLPPPPIEKAGIWPFEEPDDYYPEFIIGTDSDGDEQRYTCNPDALANYFGANPEAPHYLTPVHFRRDVLQKYYEQPEKYAVSDGYLRCASLWSVRIDNNSEHSVVVFLGDLGRDLPVQERDYWRSFNILPDAPVSETLVRRAFLGQFSEPQASDLRVRSKYHSLNKLWQERHGWDFFLKPEEADAGLLQRLRLPLNDSQAEFETSIRIMTLLMVDSLNEAQITYLLPDKRQDEKGISKLKRWLEQEGYPHVERDIQFLRNLQELRSRIAAHRKSSSYHKTLDKVFGELRGPAAIKTLFEAAFAMLAGLEEWAATEEASADAS